MPYIFQFLVAMSANATADKVAQKRDWNLRSQVETMDATPPHRIGEMEAESSKKQKRDLILAAQEDIVAKKPRSEVDKTPETLGDKSPEKESDKPEPRTPDVIQQMLDIDSPDSGAAQNSPAGGALCPVAAAATSPQATSLQEKKHSRFLTETAHWLEDGAHAVADWQRVGVGQFTPSHVLDSVMDLKTIMTRVWGELCPRLLKMHTFTSPFKLGVGSSDCDDRAYCAPCDKDKARAAFKGPGFYLSSICMHWLNLAEQPVSLRLGGIFFCARISFGRSQILIRLISPVGCRMHQSLRVW